MISEERALPSTEAVEGHGNGNGHIDADHACLDTVGKGSRRVAVAGEDGGAVAELMVVDEFKCGFEGIGADDAEDRSEDLFAIDAHVGFYVIEEAGAEKEAFAAREDGVTSIDEEGCTFGASEVEVTADAVKMLAGDERAEIGFGFGAGRDLQGSDAGAEPSR